MAILLAPDPETTKVFRRAATDLSPAGKWHLPKAGRDRISVCGDFINHFHEIDLARLEDIRAADLCTSCWLFGAVDVTQAQQLQTADTLSEFGE